MNTTCPPAAAQRGQQRQRKGDRANDIDLEGGAPLVDCRLGDPAGIGHPGVVHQHVEFGEHLGGSPRCASGRSGPAARWGRRAGRRRRRARPRAARRAAAVWVGASAVGDGGAEAAAGAGDQRGRHSATLGPRCTDLHRARPPRRTAAEWTPWPRSQLRPDAARGPRRLPAAGQRPGRDDHRRPAAVPAHVELGRRVRRGRAGAAERRAGRRRTRHAAVGAVEQRHDPAHRVRQRGRRILPRPGPLGVFGAGRQRPRTRHTSGITQPPVHAIAVQRILDHARSRGRSTRAVAEAFLDRRWDDLVRWHRWLAEARDQNGAAASRCTTAGSPAWTTRRAGMAPTPT